MASTTSVCEISGFLTLLSQCSICKALTVQLEMAESKSTALLVKI